MKKQLILILSTVFSFTTLAGIEWTKTIADETEALDLICGVRDGNALVISPVDGPDQFEMLRDELGPNGVPLLGKNDKGQWTFNFKGCRDWEHPAFVKGAEGNTALLRIGKGLLVLTSIDAAKNDTFKIQLERELSLQNSGIVIRGITCGIKDGGRCHRLHRGEGYVDINLVNWLNDAVSVDGKVIVESPDGKKEFTGTTTKDKKGNFNVRIEGDFFTFGETHVAISMTDQKSGKSYDLADWTLERPIYFKVVPPEYRGLISAARRDPTVHLGAHFDNGRKENFAGRDFTAVVTSPTGVKVLDYNGKFGESNDIAFDVPLARDAAEGIYKIVCDSTGRDGEKVHAEDTFKIVPVRKGQVFIDQDGGLLADGKPWYPFGMYHLANKTDVDAAVDMGLDMIHLWGTSQEMIDYFKIKNLRLVVETSAWPQIINNWAKWGGVPPPVIDFETNAHFRAYAEMILKEPECLAFWYTSDEGGASELPGISRINKYWHELDPEDHPTYLVTTHEPRMKAGGDIFGLDCYPRSFGSKGDMRKIGDLIDNLFANNPPGRCIIAVPESFGCTADKHKETPEECKCMSYLSMVHGAKGIFWYCWWDPGNQGACNDLNTRQAIKEVTSEAKEFKLALLAPGFTKFKSSDERIHGCVCGDDTTGRFVICVNGTDDPSDSPIESPALKGLSLEPLFGSPTATPDANGKMVINLKAMERAVYKVK